MDRDGMIRLVEHDYFGNVAAARIDAALACFCDGAEVTIRHGDLEPRIFRHGADQGALEGFLRHLTQQYDPWFGDFEHYVDVEQQRIASRFTVRLTTRMPESHPSTVLKNCNFFDLEDGQIRHMLIYYTNPGAESGEYTGYPTG